MASSSAVSSRVFLKQRGGLDDEQINRAFLRCPRLETAVSEENMKSVLDFLATFGIISKKRGKLAKVLTACPQLLAYSVTEKLQPATLFLQGLGINPDQISYLIIRFPSILTRNMEEKLCPLLSFLQGLGLKEENLPQLIISSPRILSYSLERKLIPAVEYLQTLGLKLQQIGKAVSHYPQLLGYSIDKRLRPSVKYLKELGLGDADVAFIAEKYPHIIGRNAAVVFSPRVNFLRSHGFDEKQVAAVVSRFPPVLIKSITRRLQPSIEFLEGPMERSVQDVVQFPLFFGKSLRRTIEPRHRALKQNAIVPDSLSEMLDHWNKGFALRYGIMVEYPLRRNQQNESNIEKSRT